MTNPNEPIYPNIILSQREDAKLNMNTNGLTKREYFAAKALQGILAGTSGNENLASVSVGSWADVAVQAADCLIDELNKP